MSYKIIRVVRCDNALCDAPDAVAQGEDDELKEEGWVEFIQTDKPKQHLCPHCALAGKTLIPKPLET